MGVNFNTNIKSFVSIIMCGICWLMDVVINHDSSYASSVNASSSPVLYACVCGKDVELLLLLLVPCLSCALACLFPKSGKNVRAARAEAMVQAILSTRFRLWPTVVAAVVFGEFVWNVGPMAFVHSFVIACDIFYLLSCQPVQTMLSFVLVAATL